MLAKLLEAGVDTVRVNYSHGTLDDKTEVIKRLREAEKNAGRPLGILCDLPGPKLRLGTFPGEVNLVPGERVKLVCGVDELDDIGPAGDRVLPIQYAGLSAELQVGDPVLLNDGTVRMTVVASDRTPNGEVVCEVNEAGMASSRKGVNVPGTLVELPSIGPKDEEALRHALTNGVDFVAVSYVRTAEDLAPAKALIDELSPGVPMIAKIEHPAALQNMDAILDVVGAVMVARGDLGVELPYEEIPLVQESIIHAALSRGLPVIVATHVLESMIHASTPTRAEVQDIANSIRQGTHAIMLSGETASGDFPLQSVQTMAKVAEHVDIALAHAQLDTHPAASGFQSTRALANAAVALTKETDVQRLLVATATGISVSLISAHRPRVPVTAMTDSLAAMRRTCILWGVNAVLVKEHSNSRLTIKDAVDQMLADGRMSGGDSFVAATGSPTAIHAPTNTVRLIQLDDDGEVLDLPPVSSVMTANPSVPKGTEGVWSSYYRYAETNVYKPDLESDKVDEKDPQHWS